MLFEQNIASNVTRNVRPSTPKHSEQLLGTYGNLLNTKKHEIFDFKKTSYGRRKKERRMKNKAVFRFASND